MAKLVSILLSAFVVATILLLVGLIVFFSARGKAGDKKGGITEADNSQELGRLRVGPEVDDAATEVVLRVRVSVSRNLVVKRKSGPATSEVVQGIMDGVKESMATLNPSVKPELKELKLLKVGSAADRDEVGEWLDVVLLDEGEEGTEDDGRQFCSGGTTVVQAMDAMDDDSIAEALKSIAQKIAGKLGIQKWEEGPRSDDKSNRCHGIMEGADTATFSTCSSNDLHGYMGSDEGQCLRENSSDGGERLVVK